jgi:secreted Zn-dependent insulinase-like peptidase
VVRLETFLAEFGTVLATMSADKFKDNVAAVIAQKLERPKNLREEADELWGEIVSETRDFKR